MSVSIQHLKQQIYSILEGTTFTNPKTRWVNLFLLYLILLNALTLILQTVPSLKPYDRLFEAICTISIVIFTVEYVFRLWSITTNPKYSHPLFGRLSYALHPLMLLDLLVLVPFYFPFFLLGDFRVLRILRLFRLLMVFKLVRYSQSVQAIVHALKTRKVDIFLPVLVVLVILVIASSLMYFVEHDAQPNAFASIPHAMWWGVMTLTTVGYGDIYPVTPLGKLLAGIIAFLGIGVFALPTGILSSIFVEELRRHRHRGEACPHCGNPPTTND